MKRYKKGLKRTCQGEEIGRRKQDFLLLLLFASIKIGKCGSFSSLCLSSFKTAFVRILFTVCVPCTKYCVGEMEEIVGKKRRRNFSVESQDSDRRTNDLFL